MPNSEYGQFYLRAKVTYVNMDIYEGGYNEGKQRHGNGTYTWHSLTPEPEELDEGTLRVTFAFDSASLTSPAMYPMHPRHVGTCADEEPPPPPPLVVYSGDYLYGQKHGVSSLVVAIRICCSHYCNGD